MAFPCMFHKPDYELKSDDTQIFLTNTKHKYEHKHEH